MKGKSQFTKQEVKEICQLIQEKLQADPATQKKIRDRIRKIGFYASDFGIRGGYTVKDFLEVIEEKTSTSHQAKRLEKLLNRHFKDIWRCADLWKWQFIKDTNLLSFDWLDSTIDYRSIDLGTLDRGMKAIKPWVHEVEVGDLIFIMNKNAFNGIAIAQSKYEYKGPTLNMGDALDKPAIKVEYIFKLDHPKEHGLKTHNNPATFAQIDQYNFGLENTLKFLGSNIPEAIAILENYVSDNSEDKINKMQISLNQILYGPPGTGKTYHTVDKAVQIAVPENYQADNHPYNKQIYNKLIKLGRIAFTTFHQSLGYEDFIEGLKPQGSNEEGDSILYKVEDGIFKKLCIEAAFSIGRDRSSKETEELLDFSLKYDAFIDELGERLSMGEVKLKTKTGGEVLVDSVSDRGNVIIKHIDGNRSYTVSKNRLSKLNSSIKNLEDISNINDQFREIIGGSNSTAYWTVLNAIRERGADTQLPKDRSYSYDEKKDVVGSMGAEDYQSNISLPYVLIIDEINRGNVSQIFGELITLLEQDKRAGEDEALEALLPYSREKFSVPPNLYIIGTMNTADRSVEALDVALRRRFTFEYMPPNPGLLVDENHNEVIIEEISLKVLLETINERISFLKDDDHQIGHSYLMSTKTPEELAATFNHNIIPLLKEYFYNDYGKIRLVLGDGFVETKEDWKPEFAVMENDEMETTTYQIKPINKDNIIDALKQTLGQV